VTAPVKVNGTLFNAKKVEVVCTVCISSDNHTPTDQDLYTARYRNAGEPPSPSFPLLGSFMNRTLSCQLCYPIGSPLPLIITFTGTDSQALDLLSVPSSIQLHLVRSIATGSDAAAEDVIRRSNNFFLESVGQAFFWPSSEGAPEAGSRSLQGELEVKKTLKPGFLFPRFSIRVSPRKQPHPPAPLFSPDPEFLRSIR